MYDHEFFQWIGALVKKLELERGHISFFGWTCFWSKKLEVWTIHHEFFRLNVLLVEKTRCLNNLPWVLEAWLLLLKSKHYDKNNLKPLVLSTSAIWRFFLGTHFGALLWPSLPETNYKNDSKPHVLSTFAIWGDLFRVLFRTFREVFENNLSEPMLWKHYCYSVCAKTYSEIRKLGFRI